MKRSDYDDLGKQEFKNLLYHMNPKHFREVNSEILHSLSKGGDIVLKLKRGLDGKNYFDNKLLVLNADGKIPAQTLTEYLLNQVEQIRLGIKRLSFCYSEGLISEKQFLKRVRRIFKHYKL